MADLDELYKRMAQSPESKINYNLWMFQNNFRICDGNFRDLQKFYDNINNPSIMATIKEKPDYHNEIQIINLDFLRRISNYLSSAFTLVGYARDFMKKNYSGTATFEIYEKKVDESFIQNNLSKFIQDLRNYFLHNGIKGFSYSFSISEKYIGESEFNTILQKKDLCVGDYFSKKSREYMATLPDSIKIIDELKKYHTIVQGFYDWLFGYLWQIHSEELLKAKQYQKEYFEELRRMYIEHLHKNN